MPLPQLKNWNATARSLHQAAELIGGIRRLLLPHVPNWLELTLKVMPQGISSDVLPQGGEIRLDFQQAALVYQQSNGQQTPIPLHGQTQTTLFQALLKAMQPADLAPYLKDARDDTLVETMLAAMDAKKQVTHGYQNTPLHIAPKLSSDYAEALYRIFTAVARFRAHLNGHLTPIVVWPEHFDLSTLWFVEGDMDDHKAHINIGFAPFSPGFERPYLYAYAYPYPPDLEFPQLPSPAYWNFEGWKGVVVDYDVIAAQADPEAFIETRCMEIFNVLQKILQ